ncbi:MAG: hypothetical protein M5R36_29120 [Deltaproteobacteria bacterium]|nr:hypothetical protein [Deltaproteobacteria bacterium]
MSSTSGTGQVIVNSPLVERLQSAQHNQAQNAGHNASEIAQKRQEREAHSVPESDTSEKVTIHRDPEKERGRERQKKKREGDDEQETPPARKHIDITV